MSIGYYIIDNRCQTDPRIWMYHILLGWSSLYDIWICCQFVDTLFINFVVFLSIKWWKKTNFKFVFIKFGVVDQLCTFKPDRPDGRCHDLITLTSTTYKIQILSQSRTQGHIALH